LTSYGQNLKLSIYGGSHDPEIGVRLSGLPAGEQISMDALRAFMKRRAPGQNAYSTTRKEPDEPIFLSGLSSDFITNGDDLHAVIYNKNQRSSDYDSLSDIPRPSHADFAARMKYGDAVDLRGGGHFSGRLTAPMCIAGGICKQILAERGIFVAAHILSVASVRDEAFSPTGLSLDDIKSLEGKPFPTISDDAGDAMRKCIEEARLDADSVGGIIECAAIGMPAGIGEHMFSGVEGRIAGIVFGIPAVKGLAFGGGFDSARKRGSENNDPFYVDDSGEIRTKTNHAGGILGGMTSGMPILFTAAIKPTPSIGKEQESVSLSRKENLRFTVSGRHDPCIVPRAVPVMEAAMAIALTDLLLDQGELPPCKS
jgi:chorismate synthase